MSDGAKVDPGPLSLFESIAGVIYESLVFDPFTKTSATIWYAIPKRSMYRVMTRASNVNIAGNASLILNLNDRRILKIDTTMKFKSFNEAVESLHGWEIRKLDK